MKNTIIEYGAYTIINMAAFYFIFGKKSKYLSFPVFVSIVFCRKMGKEIGVLLQKDNAGGTTPHNPLKIPAKKITPIR